MSEPKEIFVRLDRCMGCRSCELACAVEHSGSKSLYGAMAEQPRPKHRLYVESVSPSTLLCPYFAATVRMRRACMPVSRAPSGVPKTAW